MQPINRLLLPKSERDIDTLFGLFELVDSFYARPESIAEPERIAALLEPYATGKRKLDGYEDYLVVSIANTIVEMLTSSASITIPTLINRLEGYDTRYIVSTMLGWFGPQAEEALPALISLASYINGATSAARQAVLRIGGVRAKDEVLHALEYNLSFQSDEESGEEHIRAMEFGEQLFLLIDLGYVSDPDFLRMVQRGLSSNKVEIRTAALEAFRYISEDSGSR